MRTGWQLGDGQEALQRELDKLAQARKRWHMATFGQESWHSYEKWINKISPPIPAITKKGQS